MNFEDLRKQIQKNAEKLQQGNQIFTVDYSTDDIWNAYISGFDNEDVKQEHSCNSCKSFLRQWGSLCAIINNKIVTLWDGIKNAGIYQKSVDQLANYIKSRPIKSVYLCSHRKCGTDSNIDLEGHKWTHFYIELSPKFVNKTGNITTIQADHRTDRKTLERGIVEITQNSVETVLDLIAQNSLYRGNEFKSLVESFREVQNEALSLADQEIELYLWEKTSVLGPAVCRIRNSSIGTLLQDLSNNMDLEAAVKRYEQVVAPTNYKRPNPITTPKMVEDARKKLQELGCLDSIERRFAVDTDLGLDQILYVDRSTELQDIFAEMAAETKINPRKLKKTEEISAQDFIEKVLPNAKSVEILIENKHLSNFVSLIAPANPQAPSLFKWSNAYSWSYTGGITDSLRDKVAKLGGRVDGVFRFSHSWNEIEPNRSLMDLHVFMPGCRVPTRGGGPDVRGRRVGWNCRKDRSSGGSQDVDFTKAANPGEIPVENITFPDINKMPEGVYTCCIHNWQFRQSGGRGKAEIEFGGQIFEYEYPKTKNHQWVVVAEVTLKNGEFTIKHHLSPGDSTQEKWGLKTNTFVKVRKFMLSPNYWQESIGNKHFFFILDNCVSDEQPRAVFNEFLKQEFNDHRRVFELLGSKIKIEQSQNQLSGLGFSETKRSSVIVRVKGSFERTLKVNF